MAGELQVSYQSSRTVYVLIRNSTGLIWNGSAFVNYLSANYATYIVSLTEQGTSSAYYAGTFPSTILAGVYSVTAKAQVGGSPAETDPTIGVGDLNWGGSATLPLSDLVASGQIASIRIARGTMVRPWTFKMVSSADHVTPFVSGVISGQISRDGGSFGALQSGAFAEMGLGWYSLQALTSGDLLCNTASLVFTGTGISGGTSDQRDFGLVLQRVSG